ncbi:MAG: glycogen debranching enzyme N-terminal domain-containing protein [Verrucomicrobiales bacterium]|nr:glycogen debranching enzyme N-terminal domain-containing protein [Verrucomicrobiales bacterium]
MPELQSSPAPGERLVRFVGDRVAFALRPAEGEPCPPGWRAFLRTNLGRADALREEIITAVEAGKPSSLASWRDIPLAWTDGAWRVTLPLAEVGWFEAKAYAVDPHGWQHWPPGDNLGLAVQPAWTRSGNTIYCAFTRMFGRGQEAATTTPSPLDAQLRQLDEKGYSVIPPSGTFRDLARELPHIFDRLGCRILHLLPVHPTPTTFARFGRFGSPYACQDLLAIDPALVEFDQKTTGLDQFRELARAVHAREGRLFLDIVINHTGWGSTLWENRPDWFERLEDGRFKSPGAWGNTWEDLVELRHDHPGLRRYIADALLEWCRRGVDGFRCDAGYMVPLEVWRYIVARVRQEFPDTVFLLEGLGGSWEATETLLTRGNLQWAYSELFQNYSGAQVAWYLDYALARSRDRGLYVHYSETHDNARLGAKGRAWSLLRNRLCALTSVSGGFGFTCGVEWLAAEQVNVHSRRGLAWGNEQHLIPELGALNRLLASHPCFFDGAQLTRLSGNEDPVFALLRRSGEGQDAVLVLVNTDPDHERECTLEVAPLAGAGLAPATGQEVSLIDLLGQTGPEIHCGGRQGLRFRLGPGAAYCLATQRQPSGVSGTTYSHRRALEAFALQALGRVLPVEALGDLDLPALADHVERDVAGFLAAIPRLRNRADAAALGRELFRGSEGYPAVIRWEAADVRRVTPWPGEHWLLVEDPARFRVTLRRSGRALPEHAVSVRAGNRHVAAFWADNTATGEATLEIERYGDGTQHIRGSLRSLNGAAETGPPAGRFPEIVLLTNGCGGMARLPADFGGVRSKYDCLLGANLHPRVPVDRHVLAKRARVWVNADGFLSPLNADTLAALEAGPPARWRFRAPAGDGRTAEIDLEAAMVPGGNTTVLRLSRPRKHARTSRDLPPDADVRLTVRIDIEDRSFHQETKHNSGADRHFRTHTARLPKAAGFQFRPAADRQLRVWTDHGKFHPEAEWCFNIPHPVEQTRGQEGHGDAYSPGWFEIAMPGGAAATMVICADPTAPSADAIAAALASPDDAAIPDAQASAETAAQFRPATAGPAPDDRFDAALRRACEAFVVGRDGGKTVVAGYPWFLDWGRDTLICARGLLAGGWRREVLEILKVFGRFEEGGTLPNAIHGDNAANRETSDAPLWYGLVCEEYADGPGDALYRTCVEAGGRTVGEVLRSIACGYLRGTTNGIRVDPASGLVWSPSHFTWMDTNHPAGTPREGYPVEIQALWIRLLRQLARLEAAPLEEPWSVLAERAGASFASLFWLETKGWPADVLLAPPGRAAADATPSDALRSNCLLAVALGLFAGAPARRTVEAARRWLVTPGALRSLAPLRVSPPLPVTGPSGALLNHPDEPYWGRYEGDEDTRRKPAYHNGTAWTWTFPGFCEALVQAWGNEPPAVAAARAYLAGMDRLLAEGCAGQLPEIVDGDAPHAQRGCDAQAWGVTEALRVWRRLADAQAVSEGETAAE